ncbi:MAG: hypothetical protein NC348_13885, partial [Clostridium sp.]|nr:hypothetical protein [Clostridium sp.]
EARERYYREQEYMNKRIAELERGMEELEKGMEKKDTIINALNAENRLILAEKAQTIDALNAEIQRLRKMLEENPTVPLISHEKN